jgi:hypothetical protein
MPDIGNVSTPVWRYAYIVLPTSDTDLAVEHVKIRPFKTLHKGYFKVMDLVGSYPCVEEPPRNCSFDVDSCGWQGVSSFSSSFSRLWSRTRWPSHGRQPHELGWGYILSHYPTYDIQNKKSFVILRHPTVGSRGHRCFAFHYVMSKTSEDPAGWGFFARVVVNGKVYSKLVPTNASGEWHLGKMNLPEIEGVPMHIEFHACRRCYVGLDNFIFSYLPCKSDTNECHCSKYPCDHICINTFGSFSCSCNKGYTLDTNNKTCIPVCQGGCFYGSCVAPNTCKCHKGITGRYCHLTCGETYLKSKTGMITNPKRIANQSSTIIYSYKHHCEWIIRASPGHVVALEIDLIHWSGSACQYTNLTIRNKKNPHRNVTNSDIFCTGHQTSRRVLSTTNKLFISYFSTHTYDVPRFNLKYQIHKTEETMHCVSECSSAQWWQQCCFGYLVAVPSVLRQGTNATVDIQLQKIKYAVTVVGELVNPNQQQLEPVKARISDHGSLMIHVPDDLPPDKYLFKVVVVNGEEVLLSGSTEVAVASRGPTVLVQTDKPVYKPGQTGVLQCADNYIKFLLCQLHQLLLTHL